MNERDYWISWSLDLALYAATLLVVAGLVWWSTFAGK